MLQQGKAGWTEQATTPKYSDGKKAPSTMAELSRENKSEKQPNATQHTTKAIQRYSLVHADQGSSQSRARSHRPVEAQPVRDT